MTSGIRELLRDLAPEPTRQPEIAELLAAAGRGRRRRYFRRGLAGGLLVVLVAGAAAIALISDRPGSSPRVQTPATTGQSVQGPGASLTLPQGWQQIPVLTAGVEPITGDRSPPPEVLVVGTKSRPASRIEPCQPSPLGSAAYLIIAGGPIDPRSPTTLPPRPAQFTVESPTANTDCGPSGAGSPSGTTGATTEATYHVRLYSFSGSGDDVLAEVVSVGDPSEALLHQGVAILNTLQLAPIGGLG